MDNTPSYLELDQYAGTQLIVFYYSNQDHFGATSILVTKSAESHLTTSLT